MTPTEQPATLHYMKLINYITILKDYCKNVNRFTDGVKIRVTSDIQASVTAPKIIYTFNVQESDYLIYIAGLVNSNWDSSKFRNDNNLPPLKFEVTYETNCIPDKTFQLTEAYKIVSAMSVYDKKENNKLQKGKEPILKKLARDISATLGLGTGFIYDSNPFDPQFVAGMEKILIDYIETLKKWKSDKEQIARDNEQAKYERDAKLKADCIKVLVSKGLSSFALNQFSSEILYKQVENLLTEEFRAEYDGEIERKQYDDNGRFYETPEVSYDSVKGEFNVYLRKEYY